MDSAVLIVLVGKSFEVCAAGRGQIVETVKVGLDAQVPDCLAQIMSPASPLLSSRMPSHLPHTRAISRTMVE